MPSYFFHVKIDLTHALPNLEGLVQRDHKLLTYKKIAIAPRESDDHSSKPNSPSEGLNVRTGPGNSKSHALSKESSQYPEQDWREGVIHYESVNMLSPPSSDAQRNPGSPSGSIRTGLSSIYPGLATKARFEPSDKSDEPLGHGIVRLFRDTEETPGLYELLSSSKSTKHGKRHPTKTAGSSSNSAQDQALAFNNEDCTTLCILTVPTWWDVAKLVAFLGEEARNNVSHFRMIRTETAGRNMLLMKFRDGKVAREWRKEWNGKVFDPAAPTEYCQVVFVKSVEVREQYNSAGDEDSLDDPFVNNEYAGKSKQLPSIASLGSKPMPPPTRPLQEMPTCPVCLERMDDSSGLLTIPCQHTFHCICLVKWQKNGCPVCRFTQDEIVKKTSDPNDRDNMNECYVCRSDVNLWICLICGSIGCGRYDGAHAYLHWKQTGHSFSLDMTDQRIWDYASDGYVHRIMQNKLDGKMMELPSAAGNYDNHTNEDDVIPKAKFEAMGAEYTQLLMSQLDSQRMYYEQKLEIAADRASEAQRNAAQASDAELRAVQDLSLLQAEHNTLAKEILPSLERDRQRFDRRAAKFEEMSRQMEKSWREEKTVVEGLLETNNHLQKKVEKQKEEIAKLNEENSELKDSNHDLLSFVSGKEKIRSLNDADIEGGTVYIVSKRKDGSKVDKSGDDKTGKNDKKKRRKAKQRGKGGRGEALAILGKGDDAATGVDANSASVSELDDDDDTSEQDEHDGKGKGTGKVE